MEFIAFVLSIAIGGAVGLLGGGGSILTTPMLLYVVGLEPTTAIASSLLIVAVTSGLALWHHAKDGHVRWRTGFVFGSSGMAGAFVGGQLGSHLPSEVLLVAFSIMMAATAIAMVRGRKEPAAGHVHSAKLYRIIMDGAAVGFLAGLVGAGGGFMVVPALVLLGGLAMRSAVATSLLVVTLQCVAAFAGYTLRFGDGAFISINQAISLDPKLIAFAMTGAAIGSVTGSMTSARTHPERLRLAFGWFVLVMAMIVLAENIGASAVAFAERSGMNAALVIIGVVLSLVAIVTAMRWRTDDEQLVPSATK